MNQYPRIDDPMCGGLESLMPFFHFSAPNQPKAPGGKHSKRISPLDYDHIPYASI